MSFRFSFLSYRYHGVSRRLVHCYSLGNTRHVGFSEYVYGTSSSSQQALFCLLLYNPEALGDEIHIIIPCSCRYQLINGFLEVVWLRRATLCTAVQRRHASPKSGRFFTNDNEKGCIYVRSQLRRSNFIVSDIRVLLPCTMYFPGGVRSPELRKLYGSAVALEGASELSSIDNTPS